MFLELVCIVNKLVRGVFLLLLIFKICCVVFGNVVLMVWIMGLKKLVCKIWCCVVSMLVLYLLVIWCVRKYNVFFFEKFIWCLLG